MEVVKICVATIGVCVFRCADLGWRTFCFYGFTDNDKSEVIIMSLEIIRKIDNLGRIVIPKDLREMLGVKAGDEIVITVGEGHIIISGRGKEGK